MSLSSQAVVGVIRRSAVRCHYFEFEF